MLKTKRVYEARQRDDGKRIFVDRLWPRGLRSDAADIDEWAKDLAPSDELRRWFRHQPERWPEFKRRYIEELSVPEKMAVLKQIARWAVADKVTLLFAAQDTEHNNARVLAELISGLMEELT